MKKLLAIIYLLGSIFLHAQTSEYSTRLTTAAGQVVTGGTVSLLPYGNIYPAGKLDLTHKGDGVWGRSGIPSGEYTLYYNGGIVSRYQRFWIGENKLSLIASYHNSAGKLYTGGIIDGDKGDVSISSGVLSLDQGAVTKDKLNLNVVGAGLKQNADKSLSVSVDNSTIEIAADKLAVRNSSINRAQLNAAVVDGTSCDFIDGIGIKPGGVQSTMIAPGAITVPSLSQAVLDLINSSGGGSVTNNADDITIGVSDSKLYVKDNSISYSKMSDSVKNDLKKIGSYHSILEYYTPPSLPVPKSVYDGMPSQQKIETNTRATNAFQAALSNLGTVTPATLYIPEGIYVITSPVTIPANITLKVDNNAYLQGTITIWGYVDAGPYKIFNSGNINVNSVKNYVVYPEWWGNTNLYGFRVDSAQNVYGGNAYFINGDLHLTKTTATHSGGFDLYRGHLNVFNGEIASLGFVIMNSGEWWFNPLIPSDSSREGAYAGRMKQETNTALDQGYVDFCAQHPDGGTRAGMLVYQKYNGTYTDYELQFQVTQGGTGYHYFRVLGNGDATFPAEVRATGNIQAPAVVTTGNMSAGGDINASGSANITGNAVVQGYGTFTGPVRSLSSDSYFLGRFAVGIETPEYPLHVSKNWAGDYLVKFYNSNATDGRGLSIETNNATGALLTLKNSAGEQFKVEATGEVIFKAMSITELPVYSDNTAAKAANLAVDRVYRTPTGQVMVVY